MFTLEPPNPKDVVSDLAPKNVSVSGLLVLAAK
jgi:hypothetical protein